VPVTGSLQDQRELPVSTAPSRVSKPLSAPVPTPAMHAISSRTPINGREDQLTATQRK
jgi:hypothetical protein